MGAISRRRLCRSALAVAAFASHAAGAETLEEAWRAALAGNGRLAAAEARTGAADAELSLARAERNPTLAAGTTATRWRDPPAFDFAGAGVPALLPLFGGDTLRTANAQVSLPVYTGGALGAAVSAASAARDSQVEMTESVRQDLKLAVAEAYVGVLRASSALDVAHFRAASLTAHARDVEDMRRTGAVPNNDYLAAAVSLADAMQGELQAQGALDVANAAYNRHVGRPLDALVVLDALREPLNAAMTSRPLAALVASAHATRPELEAFAATARALEARAAAARAARRPQLTASGGYAHLTNDFLNRSDYWFVTLAVQWSVFDGGRSRHATDSLTRQSMATLAERDDVAIAVELEVRRARHELDTAGARVEVMTGAVQQAEENLRVVRDRYRNGEGTNTEVLDAETLRALTASNLANARYDTRLAELRLARAIGAL
jgi:outer membrane protein TolC